MGEGWSTSGEGDGLGKGMGVERGWGGMGRIEGQCWGREWGGSGEGWGGGGGRRREC